LPCSGRRPPRPCRTATGSGPGGVRLERRHGARGLKNNPANLLEMPFRYSRRQRRWTPLQAKPVSQTTASQASLSHGLGWGPAISPQTSERRSLKRGVRGPNVGGALGNGVGLALGQAAGRSLGGELQLIQPPQAVAADLPGEGNASASACHQISQPAEDQPGHQQQGQAVGHSTQAPSCSAAVAASRRPSQSVHQQPPAAAPASPARTSLPQPALPLEPQLRPAVQ